MNDGRTVRTGHNVMIENRHRMSITGVQDIDMFDEYNVVLITEMGQMSIRGEDLHIINLSVDSGEVNVEGEISSVEYSEHAGTKGSFFARLFK